MPHLCQQHGLWQLDARDIGLAVYDLQTASKEEAHAICQTETTFFEWLDAHKVPRWPEGFSEIEGDSGVQQQLQDSNMASLIRFHRLSS